LLLALLFDGITIISKDEYNSQMAKAKKIIKEDIKDAPYIACYISLKCDGIWTSDPHYEGKSGIRIIKTAYLLNLMGDSD
jgi:predicted nucleic acid-binding protein